MTDASPFITTRPTGPHVHLAAVALIKCKVCKDLVSAKNSLKRNARFKKTGKV